MNEYIFPFIISLTGYIIQIFPRLFNRKFGVDVWTRLLEINLVRQNNHRIPKKIDKRFIISGNFDYPPVFPFLLSFIPKNRLEKIQGFVAPIFDCLLGIVVYIFVFSLTGNIMASLLSQIAYILTPVTALENSYLTPRSLGYFLMSVTLLLLLIFHTNYNYIYILFSIILTTILFLSHRFAMQSLIFGCLFFTILDQSIWYLMVLFSGFFGAVLLTKGYYIRVLEGHLANIRFWIVNGKYRFAHQIRGLVEAKKHTDFIGIIYLVLQKATPVALFGLNLWMIFPLGLLTFNLFNNSLTINPMMLKMSYWVLFYYLFSILVMSSKKLLPIGEGQRYLEMAAAPAAVTSGIITYQFSAQFPFLYVLFITVSAVNLFLIALAQWKAVIKDVNRSVTPALDATFKFINSLPGIPRIICIPHQITTMTLYHTKADILVNADNIGLMRLTNLYPILTKPIKDIAKQYNCNYLLLRTSFASIKELKLINPKIIFQKEDIFLIKLD